MLAAILGGILRGIGSFVPASTPVIPLEALYFLTDVFILFGVMGLYGLQHEEAGLWGFFGFVLATVGIGIIIGPDGSIAGVNVYPIGAGIFSVGLILLAIGSWRANKLPRWIPFLWILSMVVGSIGYFVHDLNLLFVISGVLFGWSFAGAGISARIIASRRL